MASTCVPESKCGTRYPGWLKKKHPDVAEGRQSNEVCFQRGNCETKKCVEERFIMVKNCGSYYVYKLSATTACPRRYCGSD